MNVSFREVENRQLVSILQPGIFYSLNSIEEEQGVFTRLVNQNCGIARLINK